MWGSEVYGHELGAVWIIVGDMTAQASFSMFLAAGTVMKATSVVAV